MSDALRRLADAVAGRYELGDRVGEGGMAVVFRARDVKHDRSVAVKVMRPELAAVLGPERFLEEIRISARLEHPHILTLIDSGEVDGVLYYVMPFLTGESLADRLRRGGRLEIAEAVRITQQVASALEYAHRQGVVHRDIKPDNILLHEGEALVTDFGIALAVSQVAGDRLTATGLSLGTPGYMSPEQAAGVRDLDARTDIYALGTVFYEMLAGRPPIEGDTPQSVLARVITERPASIRSVRPSVPAAIEKPLMRALEKEPERRFQTVAEFLAAIAAATAGTVSGRRRAPVIVAVAALVGLLAIGGTTVYRAAANRDWARTVAVPEIERLLIERAYVEGFHLARRAQQFLPDDPQLTALASELRGVLSVTSEPPGGVVSYQAYHTADTAWYPVGVTPLDSAEVPAWYIRLRVERAGYQPVELLRHPMLPVQVTLVPDSGPLDMVWIPAGTYAYSSRTPILVDSFLLDESEVTNRAYQRFVDAGGYGRPEYWEQAVEAAGGGTPSAGILAQLVDNTGRPGPASWELSRYPEGLDDHPVSGVSWFEAVAYCAFAGKSLPTYHQWKHAAGLDIDDDMLQLSNFESAGPRPVGASRAVGPYGILDQGGNVREWVWNGAGERRHVLGGGWNEPVYQFVSDVAQHPLDRSAINGIRCARNVTPLPPTALDDVALPYFDFTDIEPVDDAELQLFTRFYDYDPAPLDARIESVDSARFWIRQRVSYTAAYSGERVVAYLFLPRNTAPPYQSVVYFPGVDAFLRRSSTPLSNEPLLTFIPRSGRVLVYPIYKGTHERSAEASAGGSVPARQGGRVAVRQRMIWATLDLNRTVDYLVEREDLRNDGIGYLGISLGAEHVVPFALEPRLDALVLVGAAFDAQWLAGTPPEAAPWNFASLVRQPALMINGRHDFQHPFLTGQIPLFDALGTPAADKDTVILEAGHIPPWNEVIRHSLRWYDRYLGPVSLTGDDGVDSR